MSNTIWNLSSHKNPKHNKSHRINQPNWNHSNNLIIFDLKNGRFCRHSRHGIYFALALWFRFVGLNTYVIGYVQWTAMRQQQYMRKTKSYASQRVTHSHSGNEIRHWCGKHLMNNLLLDFWLVFSLLLHSFIRSRSVCFMHAINCPLDIQSVTVVKIGQHLSFVVTFVFTVLLHIVNCHFHNLNAVHWQWWWRWLRVALINKTDTIVRSPFPPFHLYYRWIPPQEFIFYGEKRKSYMHCT